MKISHSWLQKLIHLPENQNQISGLLTGLGLEVEAIEHVEKIKGNLEGLVIGEVLTCAKHPDADKLSKTTVDVGGAEPLHIVCGAPNVAAGQKVVVATVGATLYPSEGDAFTIKKSKIRGELSEGMICAEDEIGLGHSHAGIMILDTPLANGTPAAKYFNLEAEIVYEIGLTPNRVDAASHYGVARDLKAILNRPVVFPEILDLASYTKKGAVSVDVQDADGCPRYAGLYIENVKIGPSPEWMQVALKSIGLNPINNLVDITNYVLHELGQPMHAFDAAKLSGNAIVVRRAKAGEKLVMLDKSEKTLTEDDLIIADSQKPLALAGVMGGDESGVRTETKSVFLESAYFNPATVRKSSQKHSLKSDSSFRFERGTDPNMVVKALSRAAFLIESTGAGKVECLYSDHYPNPIENKKLTVKWRNINRLIGEELPRDTVYQILENLDIKTRPLDEYGHPGFEEEFEAEIPPYRVDVEREADITEEILRVYGIDNIKIDSALRTDFISSRDESRPEKLNQRASQLLADMGFVEIVTNSLTHPNLLEGMTEFDMEASVPLLNRLSEDLGVMRQTLLFSGLEAMAYNINRKQNNLKLFEIGKTYARHEGKYSERYGLGMYLTGLWNDSSWESGDDKVQYYHLKKSMENLLTRIGITGIQWREEAPSYLGYGQTLYWNNRKAGFAGLVKSDVAKRKEVKQPVLFGLIDWEMVRAAKAPKLKVKEVSKFPEVVRDLSVVVDQKTGFETIENLIRSTNKKLIRSISVFDVYQGDKIEAGKKAYAMSIVLQDEEQTLTDSKIDFTMNAIISKLEKDINAVIRK
jgi:phenylalanyl-tRNA synthetase beta chain